MPELARRFEIKSVDEEGEFEGHAVVFNDLDEDDDIILPGAFRNTLQERPVKQIKMLWSHSTSQPIGFWQEIREDNLGLYTKGKLLKDLTMGREVHTMMRNGIVDGMSIGFRAKRAEYDRESHVRKLLEIDLFEISPVIWPAQPNARITNVKSVTSFADLPLAPFDHTWSRRNAEARVREWAEAKDSPNERYKKAFLWSDYCDEGSFDSYRLQIADVVDGELKAVPKAIMAAAAAAQGAQGGLQVPKGDHSAIRKHLTRYYEKMRGEFEEKDLEAPWETTGESFSKALVGVASLVENERDFEGFLRDAGFSRSEAKAIVADGFRGCRRDADGHTAAGRIASALEGLSATLRSK